MNINRNIAARALSKAGQEPLTDEDIEKNSARWRVIKEFYLPTLLETLSNTEWTSQKKRAALFEAQEENLTEYKHMYLLPEDCAKPEDLLSQEEYIIEGNYLYTDDGAAILSYIQNGKKITVKVPEENTPEEAPEDFITQYDIQEEENPEEEIPEEEEDYPEYNELKLDPLLSEYVETRLASKIVLKITGDMNLYNMLYQESVLMEQKAVETTKVHSKSKTQGDKWWAEEIGIV